MTFQEWFKVTDMEHPDGKITLEMAFNAGRKSLIGKYEQDNAGMVFYHLNAELQETKLRLYGILWWAVENDFISEGKARELGKMPLMKMIDEIEQFIGEQQSHS